MSSLASVSSSTTGNVLRYPYRKKPSRGYARGIPDNSAAEALERSTPSPLRVPPFTCTRLMAARINTVARLISSSVDQTIDVRTSCSCLPRASFTRLFWQCGRSRPTKSRDTVYQATEARGKRPLIPRSEFDQSPGPERANDKPREETRRKFVRRRWPCTKEFPSAWILPRKSFHVPCGSRELDVQRAGWPGADVEINSWQTRLRGTTKKPRERSPAAA